MGPVHQSSFGLVLLDTIGQMLSGLGADRSSWGEGVTRLGKYQLIAPSVSPSLSDSSWISSVFPESLLATELKDGEFLW